MHEPPSEELVRQLTELQLCHPRDLHRARGRVRRLSFDLPAFDSVWIDSLVQLRLLTPYQAKQLEQGKAEELRIGSFVAVDELAQSHRGTTLLARRLHRRDRCVVKRQLLQPNRVAEARRQMELVLEQSDGFVHPQVVVPNEMLPSDGDELILVSRFVPGLPLNELLVRRGRFPAAVVFEIGRQLLEGLAALHSRSLVHGDIRMSNVRLTDSGLAVLVDGGIRHAVHPQVTIHDSLAPDAYDGLAPELIGTGASASASSELYAVGCLLWQLLAGRPPFVSADPLAKLAAHQTLTIEDVRVWAPDTPAMLAESILRLTSPAACARPRSFEEVLQQWGIPNSFSRSRLRQFRRLFDGAVPHFAGPGKGEGVIGWVWTAAMLCAVMGGLTVLYDSGLRNELLEVARHVEEVARPLRESISPKPIVPTIDPSNARKSDRIRGLLPLPAPSAEGVILLSEHGPYEATSVTFESHLIIRGAIGVAAEISVNESPLNLTARDVTLEQVTIRHPIADEIVALVTTRCHRLSLLNCEFLLPDSVAEAIGESSLNRGMAAVAWMSPNPRDPQTGDIAIENSVFCGTGEAILAVQTLRSMRAVNTLKIGHGAFLSLGPKCLAMQLSVDLDRVTLRNSGPLLRMAGELANETGAHPARIQVSNSVFKLALAKSGLVVIDSNRPREDIAKSVDFRAQESFVAVGTTLLAAFDPSQNRLREYDGDEQFDGLILSEIDFAGSDVNRVADSKIARLLGPRTSEDANPPGINPRLVGPTKRE